MKGFRRIWWHTLEIFGDHTMPTVLSVLRNLTFYNGLDFQLLPICQVVYKATTKWSNMWGRTWGKDGQSASLNVLFTASLSQYSMRFTCEYRCLSSIFNTVQKLYIRTCFDSNILSFLYIVFFSFAGEGVAHTQMTEWIPMRLITIFLLQAFFREPY